MDTLQAIIVGVTVGGVSGAATAWVAFRIKFERFVAMDEQREDDWKSWRGSTEKRLDVHAAELKEHSNRITRLERNGH